MAENEILDLGSPRRYRKWRAALCNPTLSPEQKAELLQNEFVSLTRKSLQGTSLYLILQACGKDRAALQAVIDSCKNRELARLAEQAFSLTQSRNVYVLADNIASMLIDRVHDNARLHALKRIEGLDDQQLVALESATSSSLRKCKAEVVAQLMASLSNVKLPKLQQPRPRRPRQSARAVSEVSLLNPSQKPPGESNRV